LSKLQDKLNALSIAMKINDAHQIRILLKDLVGDYQPSQEVVDWVYLARQEANEHTKKKYAGLPD
jgi:hypothetical protein